MQNTDDIKEVKRLTRLNYRMLRSMARRQAFETIFFILFWLIIGGGLVWLYKNVLSPIINTTNDIIDTTDNIINQSERPLSKINDTISNAQNLLNNVQKLENDIKKQ